MARVIHPHVASYAVALILRPGDGVILLKRDPDWPGWVWCRAADGISAWVPESWLNITGERAAAKRAYTSAELTVQPGVEIEIITEEAGWLLVRRAGGETGWLPAACVEAD